MSSKDELESKLKKELKSLDGEKRAAIKKAKSTKGKKAKDAVAAVEEEYAKKVADLEAKHQQALKALLASEPAMNGNSMPSENSTKVEGSATSSNADATSAADAERERKLEKARRKRERQMEKELEKQRQLEEEEANAGPSLRAIELEQIGATLSPLNLKISEVEADGHCLYRAIAAQVHSLQSANQQEAYLEMRQLCANTLLANQDEFAPFCEYTDDIPDFDNYVKRVRDSADWGGHLELRALSMALQRPIWVFSVANGKEPLKIHCITDESHQDQNDDPILLSYHLHYYALGEHYNKVVAA